MEFMMSVAAGGTRTHHQRHAASPAVLPQSKVPRCAELRSNVTKDTRAYTSMGSTRARSSDHTGRHVILPLAQRSRSTAEDAHLWHPRPDGLSHDR